MSNGKYQTFIALRRIGSMDLSRGTTDRNRLIYRYCRYSVDCGPVEMLTCRQQYERRFPIIIAKDQCVIRLRDRIRNYCATPFDDTLVLNRCWVESESVRILDCCCYCWCSARLVIRGGVASRNIVLDVAIGSYCARLMFFWDFGTRSYQNIERLKDNS